MCDSDVRRCVDRYVKDLTLSPIYSKWEIVWIVSNICFWYVLMHSAYTYRVWFTIDTVHMHTQTRLKTHTHTQSHVHGSYSHINNGECVCVRMVMCVMDAIDIVFTALMCAFISIIPNLYWIIGNKAKNHNFAILRVRIATLTETVFEKLHPKWSEKQYAFNFVA